MNAVFRGENTGPGKRYTGATVALRWRSAGVAGWLTPNRPRKAVWIQPITSPERRQRPFPDADSSTGRRASGPEPAVPKNRPVASARDSLRHHSRAVRENPVAVLLGPHENDRPPIKEVTRIPVHCLDPIHSATGGVFSVEVPALSSVGDHLNLRILASVAFLETTRKGTAV